MSVPSEFLKQHIGTVEIWIETAVNTEQAQKLIDLGCEIYNGVIVTDAKTQIQFTPTGVLGTLNVVMENADIIRLSTIFNAYLTYLTYLASLDIEMITHAQELDQRKEDLRYALIREQIYPGGELWWRNSNGVWHIRVLKLTEKNIEYQVLNSVDKNEKGVSVLRNMHLFLTQEEATDFTNEGHCIRY